MRTYPPALMGALFSLGALCSDDEPAKMTADPDAPVVDVDAAVDAKPAGTYCTKPTSGSYGLTASIGTTTLYLVGADGTTSSLGKLVVEGSTQSLQLDSFEREGMTFRATSGGFLYTWTTVDVSVAHGGNIPMHAVQIANTSFGAIDGPTLGKGRDIYCIDNTGMATYSGSADLDPCNGGNIVGVQGICGPQSFNVDVIVRCTFNESRFMSSTLLNGNVSQGNVSGPFAKNLSGLTPSGKTIDDHGVMYQTGPQAGLTMLFQTKACVDEDIDNPFNGDPIALTHIAD